MKTVIWCDTSKWDAANDQEVRPGLVVNVRLNALYGCGDFYCTVNDHPTKPGVDYLFVYLSRRFSDTLKAAGELEILSPLGCHLHLCEIPS